jgi:hypothetical protein
MQTFLPYANFNKTAKTLDNKRLNKQILEGYQILNVLSNDDPKAGWRNHPAVKMWRGHEFGLLEYVFVMVSEANSRGIKTENNVANILTLRDRASFRWGKGLPAWFYDNDLVARITTTHKANLFKKDHLHYHSFDWAVSDENNSPCCDRCNYFWVTHLEQ